MEERTATITLRIEPYLKTAFERLANDLDQTTLQLLRRHIRHMVEQHAKANAQPELELLSENTPTPKPKKGQRMAEANKRALRK